MAKVSSTASYAKSFAALKSQSELEKVLHDQHGKAGGVEFDFTHDDLSDGEWQVPPLWMSRRERPKLFPFLLFPWQRRSEKKGASQPHYCVQTGDKIWLRAVQFNTLPNTSLLDPETDRHFAFGFLAATSKNGDITEIEHPVPIFWKRRISGTGTYFGDEFYHLCERVSALLAARPLDKYPNPYLDETRRLALSIQLGLSLHDDKIARSNALRLASLGVVAGQLLTKAEQFEAVLPLATSGSKAKARARENGKKSGEKRRQKRPWAAEASTLAKAHFEEADSQQELAEIIGAELRSRKLKPPGDTTLTNHIRELQRKGDLPERLARRLSAPKS